MYLWRPRRSGCAPQRNALVLWEFLRTPLNTVCILQVHSPNRHIPPPAPLSPLSPPPPRRVNIAIWAARTTAVEWNCVGHLRSARPHTTHTTKPPRCPPVKSATRVCDSYVHVKRRITIATKHSCLSFQAENHLSIQTFGLNHDFVLSFYRFFISIFRFLASRFLVFSSYWFRFFAFTARGAIPVYCNGTGSFPRPKKRKKRNQKAKKCAVELVLKAWLHGAAYRFLIFRFFVFWFRFIVFFFASVFRFIASVFRFIVLSR